MDLFRYLAPGEVNPAIPERIGCYLLRLEGEGNGESSYHSLATTKSKLLEDCRRFLTEMYELWTKRLTDGPHLPPGSEEIPRELLQVGLQGYKRRVQDDLDVIASVLGRIEVMVESHLASPLTQPLFEIGEFRMFLGYGERARNRLRGEYVE